MDSANLPSHDTYDSPPCTPRAPHPNLGRSHFYDWLGTRFSYIALRSGRRETGPCAKPCANAHSASTQIDQRRKEPSMDHPPIELTAYIFFVSVFVLIPTLIATV